MKIRRSLVINASFPSVRTDLDRFRHAIRRAAEAGFETAEFLYRGEDLRAAREILLEFGMRGIFLGPLQAKPEGLTLCAIDEAARVAAVEAMKRRVEDAYVVGCHALLVNGGRAPHDAATDAGVHQAALEALRRSVTELLDHAVACAPDPLRPLEVRLEPNDAAVTFFELIGPTTTAVAFAQEIRRERPHFSLTIDTSHIRQLGEDVPAGLAAAEPVCRHIHLANCILTDRSSPLYGDMHPLFDVPAGEFTVDSIRAVYESIPVLYRKEIEVGVEVICRESDEDAFFDKTIRQMNWMLPRRN